MSDLLVRRIRSAEWFAFGSLLEQRAISLKQNARATNSDDLALVAIVLMAVAADAVKVAAAIVVGEPPDPAPDQEASS